MSKLAELIDKLDTYGAVKIYEINNQINIGIKYTLKIDDIGNLLINDTLVADDVLLSVIAYLIYASIYKKINIKPVVLDYTPTNKKGLENFMDIILKLLKSINYKDLTDTIIGGEFAFVDLISKKSINEIAIDSNSKELIDAKLSNLENLLFTTFFVWKEMQDAASINEYKIARERWDSLQIDTLIEEEIPKR